MRKILLILALSLFTFSGISQDTTKTHTISEVQVVGIKTEKYEPITISSISMDSIKNSYQGNDPFFILSRNTPSVFTQSDNGLPYGYSYMRIRGIDQTRINFTLNGIPLNEMEDQGIYFSNMPDFLSNISDIQVQRGVGSSKYGTTSIGGSVNLETENPFDPEISITAGAGSFESERVSLKYKSGFIGKSKFAGSLSYSKLNTNGFRYNSGSNGETVFGQFGYYGNKNTIKVYGFRGSSVNQMSWIPVDIETIRKDYRTNLNSTEEFDNFNQNFIATTWINYAKDNVKFNTSVYANNINGYYTSVLDPSENLVGRFFLNSYQTGAMSNMVYTKNRLSVNAGLNANYYQRRHRLADNTAPDIFWYSNTGFKQDFISFVKTNYTINKWNFFADAQYRVVNFQYRQTDTTSNIINTNWNFFNPKVGIKYISNKWEFWTSFSKTGREVTRTDMFRGYDHVERVVGDSLNSGFGDPNFIPNFLPEIVSDFEIGSKYSKDNLMLSSNFYFMNFNNERIATGEINQIGLLLKNPINRSFRTGIEFEGVYIINKFRFGTNLNYSYNKFLSDSSGWLTHSYTPNFIMNNSVEFKQKRFTIGLSGQFVSRTYLDNTQRSNLTTPSYYIINSNIGFNGDFLSIFLNINNIMNQRYYLPGGVLSQSVGEDLPVYYVGALRNIFLTFRFKV